MAKALGCLATVEILVATLPGCRTQADQEPLIVSVEVTNIPNSHLRRHPLFIKFHLSFIICVFYQPCCRGYEQAEPEVVCDGGPGLPAAHATD